MKVGEVDAEAGEQPDDEARPGDAGKARHQNRVYPDSRRSVAPIRINGGFFNSLSQERTLKEPICLRQPKNSVPPSLRR